MNKEFLRKKFLKQRKFLSTGEVKERSNNIIQKFIKNFDITNKIVHIYTNPIDGEVDTNLLLPHLKNNCKDVLSSKTYFKERKLSHYSLLSSEEYNGEMDVIIVPGIVFDKFGFRVGYGYGFYDRFLSLHGEAIIISFAYDFQIIDKIEFEKHDIPVQSIYTESDFYKINTTTKP